jgi:hypothetical protein
MAEGFEIEIKKPSRLYYLLPIFLGLLGGIAGYLLVQDRDKNFARRLLIAGIIMTVIWILVWVFVPAILSYMWLTSFQNAATEAVGEQAETQVRCSYGSISLRNLKYCNGALTGIIENIGTISLGNLKLQVVYKDGTAEKTDLGKNLKSGELYPFSANIHSNYDAIRILTNCSSVIDEVSSEEVMGC